MSICNILLLKSNLPNTGCRCSVRNVVTAALVLTLKRWYKLVSVLLFHVLELRECKYIHINIVTLILPVFPAETSWLFSWMALSCWRHCELRLCRSVVNYWGSGQSGQATILFQVPRKISFTFHSFILDDVKLAELSKNSFE